eukprot:3892333-Rhodomonas_salina.2
MSGMERVGVEAQVGSGAVEQGHRMHRRTIGIDRAPRWMRPTLDLRDSFTLSSTAHRKKPNFNLDSKRERCFLNCPTPTASMLVSVAMTEST